MAEILEGKVRELWPLVLGQGIVLIVLGVLAIALPPLAGLAIAVVLGFLLIVSAVADALVTLTQPHRPGFWWSLASDGLCLAVGVMFFTWPTGGLVSLSLALASFLILDGGLALGLALSHRRFRARKWTWLAVNGVLDILLAMITLVIPPDSNVQAFGVIIGADLLFAGVTLAAMGMDERALALRRSQQHRNG